MHILPVLCVSQGLQDASLMLHDIRLKRLLPGVGLHTGGPLVDLNGLIISTDTVIDLQAILFFHGPADLAELKKITERFDFCVPFRMYHVVGNMHVHVVCILMYAAEALVLFKTQGVSEGLFNIPKGFVGEFGFIFRSKTDDQMICLHFPKQSQLIGSPDFCFV